MIEIIILLFDAKILKKKNGPVSLELNLKKVFRVSFSETSQATKYLHQISPDYPQYTCLLVTHVLACASAMQMIQYCYNSEHSNLKNTALTFLKVNAS